MRSLLGGIALAFIFGAIADAQAQTTNCTSSVIGNQIYTNCYGGSLAPGPTFNSYPALRAKTFDLGKTMRDAEALRTQRLQNRLLQQQLQALDAQRLQNQLLRQQIQQLQQQQTNTSQCWPLGKKVCSP